MADNKSSEGKNFIIFDEMHSPNCPKCKSDNFDFGSIYADGIKYPIEQIIKCDDCGWWEYAKQCD